MICECALTGTLTNAGQELTGRLTTEQEVTGSLSVVGAEPKYPIYEGPYIITPLAFTEQNFDTDMKLMKDDVTVLEIPYAEVSNIHGTTVTIAS